MRTRVAVLILSTLLLGAAASSAQLADSPWPSFQNGASNSGLSAYAVPEEPVTEWTFTAEGVGPIAIGPEGTIYSGRYGINPDGSMKWKGPGCMGASVPAVGKGGTLYIAGTIDVFGGPADGKVCAVSPNGEKRWTYRTGGAAENAVLGPAGTVYVGGQADSTFYAISSDGRAKWTYKVGAEIKSSLAVSSDSTIYGASIANNIHAFAPDGTLQWRTKAGWSTPFLGPAGTIYSPGSGTLVALEPNGDTTWTSSNGSNHPVIDNRSTIYVRWGQGVMALFSDGSVKWDKDLTAHRRLVVGAQSRIVTTGDAELIDGDSSYVQAVSPNGTVKWRHKLSTGGLKSAPIIGDRGRIYVVTDSTLHAIGDARTTKVKASRSLPSTYRLGANYPNPFNPVTQIPYELPEPAHMRLEVVNLRGQVVRVLQEGPQPAGRHVAWFDGSGLPTGIYWYRLETKAVSKSRPMTLIK